MIYIPIDVRSPIRGNSSIQVQLGITNNFPEFVIELHEGKLYFDLGDECTVGATITNTDLETTVYTGTIDIMNPHRGQLICRPASKDFTMTGVNTLTFKLNTGTEILSFQITVFVQSISNGILDSL